MPQNFPMEFGHEVFSVPGNATQPLHFGSNQLTKQGAQLATGREGVRKSCRPQSVASCWLSSELSSAERATQGEQAQAPTERPACAFLSTYESRQVDELVELSGLRAPQARAASFDLELQGVVGQLSGKQFLKVLL